MTTEMTTTAVATVPSVHADRRAVTGFDYGSVSLSDLRPITQYNAKNKKTNLLGFETEKFGRVQTSTRFMTSFMSRFGISGNIFTYYTHDEVFARISEVKDDDALRLCVERGSQASSFEGKLMGVSSPTKAVMYCDEAKRILADYQGTDIEYSDGVVVSTHSPRSGDSEFKINGDVFSNRYQMHTPIDGYGRPSIYLSLLRQVCTNGAVGYARAFKSELAGGDDIASVLIRALDGFDNSEGYDALRARFEAAGKSTASVNESLKLYKTLAGLHHNGTITGSGVMKQFHALTGDINASYGLANLDALSPKKQRTLPVKCSVYGLLNFASELATHQTKSGGARKLGAYIGGLISTEYDLENTRSLSDDDGVARYITGSDAVGSMDENAIDLNLVAAAGE